MLLSLHIENIAVIKSLDIDFSSGFTALTGETGAGKSIIIDSINLLLGKKADKELIRHGEKYAMVSGLFSGISDIAKEIIHEAGINEDEDGNLLIQRTISLDGHSQIKINGRAVSLSVLKATAPILINIHGQSDTYTLTDEKNHISIIDTYAGVEALINEYSVHFNAYESARSEIKSITALENERLRRIEMLEYQIKDIDTLALHDGEEDELIDLKIKIRNSERITKQSGFVYKALKGSEKGSISYLLDRSAMALTSISDVIPEFSAYSEKLQEVLYQIDDIAESVYSAVENLDDDPTEKLNKIESRLDKISKLKRKYGLTVKDILDYRDNAYSELLKLQNIDSTLDELYGKRDKEYDEALILAKKLHSARVAAAKEIENKVKETLEFLDMPKVVFFASIKEENSEGKLVLNSKGTDTIEFYISANKGAEPQPLSKIASGGELARIMLALKSVIADKDGVMTLIFDEIDAGVSGKTARKIGIRMLELSKSSQLLCVTHSAQIASLADTHYLISKKENNKKTETVITALAEDGRIAELSRILGGINITESQRAAAVDMLKEKEIY